MKRKEKLFFLSTMLFCGLIQSHNPNISLIRDHGKNNHIRYLRGGVPDMHDMPLPVEEGVMWPLDLNNEDLCDQIYLATTQQNEQMLSDLLEFHGEERFTRAVNTLTQNAETSLNAACFFDFNDLSPRVVRFLLDNGADANIKDGVGNSPLNNLIETFNLEQNRTERDVFYEILTLLLEHGANVNAVNADGDTAFQFAIQHNMPSAVQKMLQQSPPYHFENCLWHGNNPFHIAVEAMVFDSHIADLLLKDHPAGPMTAYLDRLNDYFKSPLGLAIELKNIEGVKWLLENGANPYGLDGANSPLFLAFMFGDNPETALAMVKLLLEHKVDPNVPMKIVNNVDSKTEKTIKPLCYAMQMPVDSYEMLKLLLDYGADPRVECSVGGTLISAKIIAQMSLSQEDKRVGLLAEKADELNRIERDQRAQAAMKRRQGYASTEQER